MYKNLKLIILLILLLKNFFLRANPLVGAKDFYSSSQVLYTHCSLIPYQKFYPSSCELLFSSKEQDIEFRYASLFSFKNNGFAFGYRKLENNGNIISSAYGLKYNFLSFGSGFNIYFKNTNPLLLVNVSASVNIKNKNRTVISMNNIGNLKRERIFPELSIESAGLIFNKINLDYNVRFYSEIDSGTFEKGSSGALFDLKGRLFKKPYFYYSIGYELFYEKMMNIHNRVNAGFGSIASFTDNGVGLFFGYSYDLEQNSNRIQCNLYFNPLEYSDITPPQVSMEITCRPDNISGYFISLKCIDNLEGSGIKNWTLVFTDKPTKKSKIYKIFSGGNSVPNTVYWDLRDKKGEVLDTISFYSRIVAIDNKNNVGSSPWLFVEPCNIN